MERYLPAKTRLRRPGRLSIPFLNTTTGFAPTSATAGDRSKLTSSSLRTAGGTTPDRRRHPENEPTAPMFLPALFVSAHTTQLRPTPGAEKEASGSSVVAGRSHKSYYYCRRTSEVSDF